MGVLLDLGADPLDVDVQGPGVPHVIGPPHLVDEEVPGQEAPLPDQEQLQELDKEGLVRVGNLVDLKWQQACGNSTCSGEIKSINETANTLSETFPPAPLPTPAPPPPAAPSTRALALSMDSNAIDQRTAPRTPRYIHPPRPSTRSQCDAASARGRDFAVIPTRALHYESRLPTRQAP